jgi:hypothetical protein
MKRLYEQGRRDLNEDVLFACLVHQRRIEMLPPSRLQRRGGRSHAGHPRLHPPKTPVRDVSGASTRTCDMPLL